jgi:hypothetical protein
MSYEQDKYFKCNYLIKWQGYGVKEYKIKFLNICIQLGIDQSFRKVVSKYISGLHNHNHGEVFLFKVNDHNEDCMKSMYIEANSGNNHVDASNI